MEYGYCRISKPKQQIDRQSRNILKYYPEAVIIKEAYTGTTTDRPQWNKLFKTVKENDTIIFDSVSRMSRNADEGYKAYEDLYSRGVNLVFLKEPLINTDTFKHALKNAVPMTGTSVDVILEGVNAFLMELAKEQIKLAFIQSAKEVEDLHIRTKEGLITAKLNGKQIGRAEGAKITTKKSIEAKEVMKKHCIDFGGSLKDVEVLKMLGIDRNTFYKYKKEIKNGI